MIDLDLLKETISELMGADYSPNISQRALDNYADRKDMERAQSGPADIFNKKEMAIVKIAANLVYHDKIGSMTPAELVKRIATKFPDVDMGDWPDKRGDWKDFKAEPIEVEAYVCGVVAAGRDGMRIQLGPPKPGGCPSHWTGQRANLSGSADRAGLSKIKDWKRRMPAEERKAWKELEEIYDNEAPGSRLSFSDALQQAAINAGVDYASLVYIQSDLAFAEKVAKRQFMSESEKKEKKKKGFGEGDPPSEEIYKKREVVQEADLEASAAAKAAGDAATAFGDATGAEAEARAALADKQGAAAEAEAAYADAVGKKKDALEKIAKSDELKGKAAEKAGEVADKKEEVAAAYEELGKQEQELVKLAQNAAEESQTASEEAAGAAEEEASAAEDLQKAMEELGGEGENVSKAGEETSAGAEEFGSKIPEFGDALGTDADAAEEKRKEDEKAAEEKDAEREAADKEAAAEAESEEEAPAEEEEGGGEEAPAANEVLMKIFKGVHAEVLLEFEAEAAAALGGGKMKKAMGSKRVKKAMGVVDKLAYAGSKSSDRGRLGKKGVTPEKINTVGDLRKLMKVMKAAKLGKASAKRAINALGGGALFQAIDGIRKVSDLYQKMYNAQDNFLTGTGMDAMNVDDNIAKIIDDRVEDAFLKQMIADFKSASDDEPLPNATDLIQSYLKGTFDGWTISGGAAKKISSTPAASTQAEKAAESLSASRIKDLIREVIAEKKWGDGKSREKKVRQELSKAGVTADDLRGMVLNTVMAGEEERDMQMIKLLKDMLNSLQSIEYHMTPAKGAMSKMAQQHAAGWVNEGKIRNEFRSSAKTISEMRNIGMSMEADLYEGFMNWISSRGEDPGARINNEIADEIADTKALMQKLSAAFEEKYGKQIDDLDGANKAPVDAARLRAQEKLAQIKKRMAEVPGHHN
jgi:hypothetical protein